MHRYDICMSHEIYKNELLLRGFFCAIGDLTENDEFSYTTKKCIIVL